MPLTRLPVAETAGGGGDGTQESSHTDFLDLRNIQDLGISGGY